MGLTSFDNFFSIWWQVESSRNGGYVTPGGGRDSGMQVSSDEDDRRMFLRLKCSAFTSGRRAQNASSEWNGQKRNIIVNLWQMYATG